MLNEFLQADDNTPTEATRPAARSVVSQRPAPDYFVARIEQMPQASNLRGNKGDKFRGKKEDKLRGKSRGPILASISDNLNIFLEHNESINTGTLKGQILTDDISVWQSALVKVFHDAEVIATATVNSGGGFRCDVQDINQIYIHIDAPSGAKLVIPELNFDAD